MSNSYWLWYHLSCERNFTGLQTLQASLMSLTWEAFLLHWVFSCWAFLYLRSTTIISTEQTSPSESSGREQCFHTPRLRRSYQCLCRATTSHRRCSFKIPSMSDPPSNSVPYISLITHAHFGQLVPSQLVTTDSDFTTTRSEKRTMRFQSPAWLVGRCVALGLFLQCDRTCGYLAPFPAILGGTAVSTDFGEVDYFPLALLTH